jgi:quercetin dioxygenase-like cupin family protein
LNILDYAKLIPTGHNSPAFEGADHGAAMSLFIEDAPAGTGPRLHRHPYEEVFVVLDGELEMTIGDEVATVGAGQIAVAPANVWHGFKAGRDGARSVNIHAAPRMVQEWAPREADASSS